MYFFSFTDRILDRTNTWIDYRILYDGSISLHSARNYYIVQVVICSILMTAVEAVLMLRGTYWTWFYPRNWSFSVYALYNKSKWISTLFIILILATQISLVIGVILTLPGDTWTFDELFEEIPGSFAYFGLVLLRPLYYLIDTFHALASLQQCHRWPSSFSLSSSTSVQRGMDGEMLHWLSSWLVIMLLFLRYYSVNFFNGCYIAINSILISFRHQYCYCHYYPQQICSCRLPVSLRIKSMVSLSHLSFVPSWTVSAMGTAVSCGLPFEHSSSSSYPGLSFDHQYATFA